jgi:hypothetical protein
MKPGEVLAIRLEPMQARLQAIESPDMASPDDTTGVETVVLGTNGADKDATSAFVIDLEINSRWAGVDKALAELRAGLQTPQTLHRSPEKGHRPVRR